MINLATDTPLRCNKFEYRITTMDFLNIVRVLLNLIMAYIVILMIIKFVKQGFRK